MLNRPPTLSDGHRSVAAVTAMAESRIDLHRLLEWTERFDPSDSEILSILNQLRIVRLKSLTDDESIQAATLIERGCMRASTSSSLLEQIDLAENLFAGLNSLLHQGLVMTESATESTLGNLLTVCSVERCYLYFTFVLPWFDLHLSFAGCRSKAFDADIAAGSGAGSSAQRPP
jgi:hypothetical protein